MGEIICEVFSESLPELEWMSSETRERALEKAEAVATQIGYPAFAANPTELDAHYASVPHAPF
jgi:predicted metalloendopeptidase